MSYLSEHHLLVFLAQLAVLLSLSWVAGEVCRRLKQPALTAELLIGILLGPTVLGRFFPHLFYRLFPADPIQQGMLETIAWVGVIFLILEVGLEMDFAGVWKQKGPALKIAVSDIVIPMVIAFVPVYFLLSDSYLVDPQKRLLFALFIATIMTISAMPITARVLHEMKIL